MINKLYISIDESGTITTPIDGKHNYFVIGLVISTNYKDIKKIISKTLYGNLPSKYKKELRMNKEVKGSAISESLKLNIYSKLENKNIKYAYIICDNTKLLDRFKVDPARSYNYLLCEFFKEAFKKDAYFKDVKEIELYVDERNVKVESKNELCGYLNTELGLREGIIEKVCVKYCDSKNYPTIQLADFIANTLFRAYESDNIKAIENVKRLLKFSIFKKLYKFPKHNFIDKHNI